MVDFEWYRSFVAVYQAGTVSAAAERRSMTQPGLSQHLAALERALGTKLFQRTPRQMVPTAEGQSLYSQVIGAVEQLDRLSDPRMLRAKKADISLRIGAPREFFFAEGLRSLADIDSSGYRLHLVLGQTMTLIKQLEAGDLDLIIATQRISRRLVHYVPLRTEQFVLVAAADFRLPEGLRGGQVADWLETQPWIAYAPDLPIIRRYWQEVFERRPNLTPFLILPDLLMILRAVTLRMGISILPKYLCQEALDSTRLIIPWQPLQEPGNQLYAAVLRERLTASDIQRALSIFAGDA